MAKSQSNLLSDLRSECSNDLLGQLGLGLSGGASAGADGLDSSHLDWLRGNWSDWLWGWSSNSSTGAESSQGSLDSGINLSGELGDNSADHRALIQTGAAGAGVSLH